MNTHPPHYVVTISRHGHVIHKQQAATLVEATQLAEKFRTTSDSIVDITPVHDKAATDLTTHTREMVEDLQSAGSGSDG